jgi:hypothetical protein
VNGNGTELTVRAATGRREEWPTFHEAEPKGWGTRPIAEVTCPVSALIRHVDYFRVARDPGAIRQAVMIRAGHHAYDTAKGVKPRHFRTDIMAH